MQPITLQPAKLTETTVSPLLDLPLEIKQIIYRCFFAMHDVILQVKKRSALSKFPLHLLMDDAVALLLSCRHIHVTAKPYRRLSSVTLDLRQLHGGSSSFPEIAANLSKAYSYSLFPQLRRVRIYDYKAFRDRLSSEYHTHARLARNFDDEVRKLLRREAMTSLPVLPIMDCEFQTEIVFVCDCMICPGQKRLRHLVKFGDLASPGIVVSKDWVSNGKGLDCCPLPLDDQLASHIHEYCRVLGGHKVQSTASADASGQQI